MVNVSELQKVRENKFGLGYFGIEWNISTAEWNDGVISVFAESEWEYVEDFWDGDFPPSVAQIENMIDQYFETKYDRKHQ